MWIGIAGYYVCTNATLVLSLPLPRASLTIRFAEAALKLGSLRAQPRQLFLQEEIRQR
jgi:hypothetical protein